MIKGVPISSTKFIDVDCHFDPRIRKKYVLYIRKNWEEHYRILRKQQILTFQGIRQNYIIDKHVAKTIANMVGWQREYKGPFYCNLCSGNCYYKDGDKFLDQSPLVFTAWFFLFLVHIVIYLEHLFLYTLFASLVSFILTPHWRTIGISLSITYLMGLITPDGYGWFPFWLIFMLYARAYLKTEDPDLKLILQIISRCNTCNKIK